VTSVPGSLKVVWDSGSPRGEPVTAPPIQIHRYDESTYLLRQSKAVSYEAPFMYLLLGADRAMLLDTGATADPTRFPLRETVDGLVANWLTTHPHEGYELIVAHSHGHGDHVSADGQFADRPATTIVAKDIESVRSFFGFTVWPDSVVSYELGGRALEVTGSPGHHATAISIFDPATGFLLTGDTVYPGRLYAFDFPAFAASLDRLVTFAAARPVTHVMGCHIEMTTTPRRDYPLGTKWQPAEPPLEMTVEQLTAVRDAALTVTGRPGIHRFDDFIIVNGVGLRTMITLNASALRARLRPERVV
jgi:hydroxyacylglutathione hydrolase